MLERLRDHLRPHWPLIGHLAFTLIVTLAAMNTQNNILFWVVGVLLTVLIVSLIWSHLSIRGIEVQRLDPRHGAVGEPLSVRYRITNRRRWLPVFNLIIEERAGGPHANWSRLMHGGRAWVMHVGPGETVHGEAVFWPQGRGEVRLDRLTVRTRFPFGLVRRTKHVSQATHTLVYPRRYRLRRHVLESIVPIGPMGMKLSSRPGGGDDFFGVREYRPGDSRRMIAWKRSASSPVSDLLVIERTLPSPPRLRFVLNLSQSTAELQARLGEEHDARRLQERAISLVASFLDEASGRGFEIGLSVVGITTPVTPLRRSHWHVERLMGLLAGLDLESGHANRSGRGRALADAERAGLVVVHPGPIDPRIVNPEAWHFSAMQMERLLLDPAAMAHDVMTLAADPIEPPPVEETAA